MAIPFYEPKTETNSNQQQQNLNNALNTNPPASGQPQFYDQVDGIGFPTSFLTPPPTPPTSVPTSIPAVFEDLGQNSAVSSTIPSVSSYEQQALAWKILAITMCKALKEYYKQTSSSKNAFTNQTVHVLPDGQVQPLWK